MLPTFAAAIPHDSATSATELLIVLLAVVALLVVVARRVQVPYPILLVIGGLGLSFVPGLPRVRLDPELVFVLFLPPLLYPAAMFTSWRDFRAHLGTILSLAVGLVLATIVVVAWCAHRFVGLGWGPAFVLGAIVAPADAVAALAIAHRLKIPARLVTILEGESLVNDTAAFVAYRFAIAAVITGTFTLGGASLRFLTATLGGTLVGLLAGWLVTAIQRRLDDPPVQTTVSLVTPYVCYLAAERLGTSGVLAVVTCGLYYGWRSPSFIHARFRLRALPVWDMVQFLLNGLIFILIGLQLPDAFSALEGRSTWKMVGYIAAILVPLVALRLLWVLAMAWLPPAFNHGLRHTSGKPSWRHVLLVGWNGLRGVDSLAGALAVPLVIQSGAPFPDRDLIFFLTFAVIFGTLVLQGLSLAPIVRRLGIVDDHQWESEEHRARLQANHAALRRLRELAHQREVDRGALQRLSSEYEDRIQQLERKDAPHAPAGNLFSADFERLSLEALDAERQTILELRDRQVINDAALRRIQRDIDLAEIRLRRDREEA